MHTETDVRLLQDKTYDTHMAVELEAFPAESTCKSTSLSFGRHQTASVSEEEVDALSSSSQGGLQQQDNYNSDASTGLSHHLAPKSGHTEEARSLIGSTRKVISSEERKTGVVSRAQNTPSQEQNIIW